jgi:5-enolpyruvylshikimate-3-phosphate synthase
MAMCGGRNLLKRSLDHRIAMSFAILGVCIEKPAVPGERWKSDHNVFPDFRNIDARSGREY